MQTGTDADIDEIGFFGPADDARRRAPRRRGRLRDHGDQGRLAAARRRHAHDAGRARPPSRCRATARSSRWCSAASSRSRRTSSRSCATRSRSCELNDAALTWEPETSEALGFGFRCGFLGPAPHGHRARAARARVRPRAARDGAHRRVRRDASPTGARWSCTRPRTCPTAPRSRRSTSPTSAPRSSTPKEYVGAVMELCQERRGTHVDMTFLSQERVQLHYDLPLAEIVLDFFDQLKSRTRGYASLDYELIGMREGDLVKLDILLARRQGRRALDGRPPRQGLPRRPRAHGAPAQADPAPAVRGGDPGRDRREDHRPRVASSRCART